METTRPISPSFSWPKFELGCPQYEMRTLITLARLLSLVNEKSIRNSFSVFRILQLFLRQFIADKYLSSRNLF
jgi:hypothetical protein